MNGGMTEPCVMVEDLAPLVPVWDWGFEWTKLLFGFSFHKRLHDWDPGWSLIIHAGPIFIDRTWQDMEFAND